jgi:hypothetical protein
MRFADDAEPIDRIQGCERIELHGSSFHLHRLHMRALNGMLPATLATKLAPHARADVTEAHAIDPFEIFGVTSAAPEGNPNTSIVDANVYVPWRKSPTSGNQVGFIHGLSRASS